MDKHRTMAIWLGYFKSEKDRNDFFTLVYPDYNCEEEDDEYEYADIYSKFTKVFKIDEFDEELYYYHVIDKATNNLNELIPEYENDVLGTKEDVISYIQKKYPNPEKKYNTIIMFRNFKYKKNISHYEEEDFYIDFFCNTEFKLKKIKSKK